MSPRTPLRGSRIATSPYCAAGDKPAHQPRGCWRSECRRCLPHCCDPVTSAIFSLAPTACFDYKPHHAQSFSLLGPVDPFSWCNRAARDRSAIRVVRCSVRVVAAMDRRRNHRQPAAPNRRPLDLVASTRTTTLGMARRNRRDDISVCGSGQRGRKPSSCDRACYYLLVDRFR